MELNDRIALREKPLSAKVGEEIVVMSAEDGYYFGLTEVAGFVWALLEKGPHSLGELQQAVLDEYEVDAATARKDLEDLVADLEKRNLVEVSGA